MEDYGKCLHKALSLTVAKVGSETIALRSCHGRVLAEDIVATFPFPRYPTSIKDGYAVRSVDGSGKRTVMSALRAGDTREIELTAQSAIYVTTGSALPLGADAVVEIEQVEKINQTTIHLRSPVRAGQDVRSVGSDIKDREVLIKTGTRVTPAEVGVLATMGRGSVLVYKRPIVGIFSSGDELIEPTFDSMSASKTLGRSQIFDCNRSMLITAAEEFGALVHDLGIVGDTTEAVKSKVEDAIALKCHFVVSSGGVSEGDRDCIRTYLETCGRVYFNKVNIKPGKPMTVATINEVEDFIVFALPGNPVSSLAMFNMFVLPSLKKLAGWTNFMPRSIFVRTDEEIVLDDRPEFKRAQLFARGETPEIEAITTGMQRSSRITSTLNADVLLRMPSAQLIPNGVLPKGTIVEAIAFKDWRLSAGLVRDLGQAMYSLPSNRAVIDTKLSIPSKHLANSKIEVKFIQVATDFTQCDWIKTKDIANQLGESIQQEVNHLTTLETEIERIMKQKIEQPSVYLLLGLKNSTAQSKLFKTAKLVPGVVEFIREQQPNRFLLMDLTVGVSIGGVAFIAINEEDDNEMIEVAVCAWSLLAMLAVGAYASRNEQI